MKIEEFESVPVLYPKKINNLARYEIPANKNEFYTTKYSEFDFSVPLAPSSGEFLEIGVFKGRSLRYLADTWQEINWTGFDSFKGVQETWDLGTKKIDMKSFEVSTLPSMPDNVELVVGLVEDTLASYIERKNNLISYLNLDADIYSATIHSLKVLNNYIVPGTIIRFDELSDWRVLGYEKNKEALTYSPPTRYTNWEEGEWKALNEWITTYDRKVEPLWRSWCQSAGVRVLV